MSDLSLVVTRLLADWDAARAEVAVAERAAHPDITDRFGRVWVWFRGDLYSHDGMAWPAEWIADCDLPPAILALNLNYSLCATCRREVQS